MDKNYIELSKEFCTDLEKYCRLCKLLNIETALVDKHSMRSLKEDHTVLAVYKNKSTEFDIMAIPKISMIHARLSLLENNDRLTVIGKYSDSGSYLKSISMINEKTEINYRCCNPAILDKIPKDISEIYKYEVEMSNQDVVFMNKALNAMKFSKDDGNYISFLSKKGKIYYQIVDANNDKFEHEVSDKINILIDDEETVSNFNFKYNASILLTLLKQNEKTKIKIGQNGNLKIDIDGIDVFVLRRKDGE